METIKVFTISGLILTMILSGKWFAEQLKRFFGCRRDTGRDEEILLTELNGCQEFEIMGPNFDYDEDDDDTVNFLKKVCVSKNFYKTVAAIVAISFLVVGAGTFACRVMNTPTKLTHFEDANGNQLPIDLDSYRYDTDFNFEENEVEHKANWKIVREVNTYVNDYYSDEGEVKNPESKILRAIKRTQMHSHVSKHDLETQIERGVFNDILSDEGSQSENKRKKRIAEIERVLDISLNFSNDTTTVDQLRHFSDVYLVKPKGDLRKGRSLLQEEEEEEYPIGKSVNYNIFKMFLGVENATYAMA